MTTEGITPLMRHALAEKQASIHLAGWRDCDVEDCEHLAARDEAYLAYTKKPQVRLRV